MRRRPPSPVNVCAWEFFDCDPCGTLKGDVIADKDSGDGLVVGSPGKEGDDRCERSSIRDADIN